MDNSEIKVESKEIVDNAESQLSDSNVGNNRSSPPHTGSSRKSMSSRHSRNSRGSLRSSEIIAMFKQLRNDNIQIRNDMLEMREHNAGSNERLVGYIQSMEAKASSSCEPLLFATMLENKEIEKSATSMKPMDKGYKSKTRKSAPR